MMPACLMSNDFCIQLCLGYDTALNHAHSVYHPLYITRLNVETTRHGWKQEQVFQSSRINRSTAQYSTTGFQIDTGWIVQVQDFLVCNPWPIKHLDLLCHDLKNWRVPLVTRRKEFSICLHALINPSIYHVYHAPSPILHTWSICYPYMLHCMVAAVPLRGNGIEDTYCCGLSSFKSFLPFSRT